MTMIKPAGQQKLFNGRSASANEIIPDRARVYSLTVSSSTITRMQKRWINFVIFLRF